MTRIVEPGGTLTLDDYAESAHLVGAVQALRAEAERHVPRLAGRTVWMVNSTAAGGGVAELLPPQIRLLRDLGLDVRWVVIETDRPEFFPLTKRIHNMIHGESGAAPDAAERALYETVSRANAEALLALVQPGDILVVHDPQPLGAGALVKQAHGDGLRAIWRCHIGLDEATPATRGAWAFLEPWTAAYDEAVFSLREYVPPFLAAHATVIAPSIDPLSHKNRELSLHKLVGILGDAGLVAGAWPLLAPPFEHRATRLQPDGGFAPATEPEDLGLIARPTIVQVSRWDRLKGFAPLMEAFRLLKESIDGREERHRRRLELSRLVLAGPDPASVQDDPEALGVLDDLRSRYMRMPPAIQRDVALLMLPMASKKENALMVNALQRCADVVVQNSLREGFGLTVAEAMWKRTPVLGSARACGVRLQVRDGLDGRLVDDPEDAATLARVLADMLADEAQLEAWGRSAQRRVHDEFLVFGELRQWLRLLAAGDGQTGRVSKT